MRKINSVLFKAGEDIVRCFPTVVPFPEGENFSKASAENGSAQKEAE